MEGGIPACAEGLLLPRDDAPALFAVGALLPAEEGPAAEGGRYIEPPRSA